MYEYSGLVVRVVDGDTLHIQLDLGLDILTKVTLRVAHVNCPEMGTPEGTTAYSFVRTLLQDNFLFTGIQKPVIVRTIKDKKEKYGRYLAEIVLNDGSLLHEKIIAAGHGVPYEGGKRE